MISKFLKALVFSALINSALAQAALVRDCSGPADGLVNEATVQASPGVQLWKWDQLAVYEIPGGVSLSPTASVPEYKFANPSEKIVSGFVRPGGKLMVFTRTARGFAAYLWDPSSGAPVFKLLLTQSLDDSFGSQKLTSPLVDVWAAGSRVFLLGNFHVWNVDLDILASSGGFQASVFPLTSAIPGNDYSHARGTGLFRYPQENSVSVIELDKSHPEYPTYYDRETGFLDDGRHSISSVIPSFYNSPLYLNLLPNRVLTADAAHAFLTWATVEYKNYYGDGGYSPQGGQGAKLAILGEISQLSTESVGAYATAASFVVSGDVQTSFGVVAFEPKGTIVIKSGKPLCKLSSQPWKSLIVEKIAGGLVRVRGLDSSSIIYSQTLRQ